MDNNCTNKRCTKCGILKPLSAFTPLEHGFASICSKCEPPESEEDGSGTRRREQVIDEKNIMLLLRLEAEKAKEAKLLNKELNHKHGLEHQEMLEKLNEQSDDPLDKALDGPLDDPLDEDHHEDDHKDSKSEAQFEANKKAIVKKSKSIQHAITKKANRQSSRNEKHNNATAQITNATKITHASHDNKAEVTQNNKEKPAAKTKQATTSKADQAIVQTNTNINTKVNPTISSLEAPPHNTVHSANAQFKAINSVQQEKSKTPVPAPTQDKASPGSAPADVTVNPVSQSKYEKAFN